MDTGMNAEYAAVVRRTMWEPKEERDRKRGQKCQGCSLCVPLAVEKGLRALG